MFKLKGFETIKQKPIKKYIKRRQSKRKKHYITDIHHSPKFLNPIKYRSSWEFTTALYFDQDPNVLSYEYESIKIRYAVGGSYRDYYPEDFLVFYNYD